MKNHLYTLPAKGAAPLAIVATQPTRGVEIVEDDGSANQGLVLFFPDDNFTQGYDVSTAHQPIILGNIVARGRGMGSILGYPLQMDRGGTVELRAADILFKATSGSATPTNIHVREHD
jgi:hypothetical protein